jgi:SAM-dependent methyltransferase
VSWSETAPLWAEVWASLAEPVRARILPDVEPGMRVLDVGCGSGELLVAAAARGADVAGIDDAEGMLAIARERLPDADLRAGRLERLPWEDRSFDVVTAINALQFADDMGAALAEAARVARGRLHVANWALREDCEINHVDDALVPPPAGGPAPHRVPGMLSRLAREAGLIVLD